MGGLFGGGGSSGPKEPPVIADPPKVNNTAFSVEAANQTTPKVSYGSNTEVPPSALQTEEEEKARTNLAATQPTPVPMPKKDDGSDTRAKQVFSSRGTLTSAMPQSSILGGSIYG